MNKLTPNNLAALAEAAAAVRSAMGDDEDERAFFDTLEGESDLMEMAGKLILRRVEAQATRDAAKAVSATYSERARRCDRAADACTAGLALLLGAIGKDKLPHPLATVSRTKPRQRLDVFDSSAIPSQLRKWTPDSEAIKAQLEAGEVVPGARLVMGEPGLMVRVR